MHWRDCGLDVVYSSLKQQHIDCRTVHCVCVYACVDLYGCNKFALDCGKWCVLNVRIRLLSVLVFHVYR